MALAPLPPALALVNAGDPRWVGAAPRLRLGEGGTDPGAAAARCRPPSVSLRLRLAENMTGTAPFRVAFQWRSSVHPAPGPHCLAPWDVIGIVRVPCPAGPRFSPAAVSEG